MLAGITSEQFDEWVAMDAIEPIGDSKLAWVLALVGSVLANRLGTLCEAWGVKNVKEIKPQDFVFWEKKTKRKKKPKVLSPTAMANAVRMAFTNGDFKKESES